MNGPLGVDGAVLPPRASVVVAVHGNPAAIRGLLVAIEQQTLPSHQIELVVVDNHRWPALTRAAFAGATTPVVLLHEPKPGLSRARNAAIRRARGNYVLVTDPDSRPHPDWAERLIDALETTGAACGGGRAVPVVTGPARRPLDAALLGWFVPPEWPDNVTDLQPPYWLVGCNMAFRRTEPPTLFSEWLGAVGRRHRSCEDLEIVARHQDRGERIVVVPAAVVDRAVHPADLGARSIARRALWHGISMARLARMWPGFDVYDDYRLRGVARSIGAGIESVAALCRVAGYRLERLRLRAAASPPTPAPIERLAPRPSGADITEGAGHAQ